MLLASLYSCSVTERVDKRDAVKCVLVLEQVEMAVVFVGVAIAFINVHPPILPLLLCSPQAEPRPTADPSHNNSEKFILRMLLVSEFHTNAQQICEYV